MVRKPDVAAESLEGKLKRREKIENVKLENTREEKKEALVKEIHVNVKVWKIHVNIKRVVMMQNTK